MMQSKYTDHIEFQRKTIFMVAVDLGWCYGMMIDKNGWMKNNTLGNYVCYVVSYTNKYI